MADDPIKEAKALAAKAEADTRAKIQEIDDAISAAAVQIPKLQSNLEKADVALDVARQARSSAAAGLHYAETGLGKLKWQRGGLERSLAKVMELGKTAVAKATQEAADVAAAVKDKAAAPKKPKAQNKGPDEDAPAAMPAATKKKKAG